MYFDRVTITLYSKESYRKELFTNCLIPPSLFDTYQNRLLLPGPGECSQTHPLHLVELHVPPVSSLSQSAAVQW